MKTPTKAQKKWDDEKWSHAQRQHLLARVDEAQRTARQKGPPRYHDDCVAAQPPAVRRARKIIEQYEKKIQQLRKRYEEDLGNRYAAVRERIFFGQPHEALEAVKEFERKANHS